MKTINGIDYELNEELNEHVRYVMAYPYRRSCTGCIAMNNRNLCRELGDKCLKKEYHTWKRK